MNLKDHFIFICYSYFCRIYQFISTIFENYFFLKSNPETTFIKRRIFSYQDIDCDDFDDFENLEKVIVNEFLSVRVISKELLDKLIRKTFTYKFRNYISKKTGFKYSIDFMIFYDRKFIPLEKRKVSTLKQAYSYRWHFDKPNSRNMLKVFIPFNVSKKHGPLEAIDYQNSQKIKNLREIKSSNKKLFLGNKNTIYAFIPTLCLHRDGIPEESKEASQIMFQLNPSDEWKINSNIHKRSPNLNQKLGIWTNEPKFPFFSYFMDKKVTF